MSESSSLSMLSMIANARPIAVRQRPCAARDLNGWQRSKITVARTLGRAEASSAPLISAVGRRYARVRPSSRLRCGDERVVRRQLRSRT
jgi:hypothetical protein